VGIMSYNGKVHFGLIGDYEVMADIDSLALDLEASISELSEATPKPKKAKAKGTGKSKRAAKAKAKAGAEG
jgi:diacylglycerol O-acyltransferase / wax synthase